jgi:hypothetical protein
VKRSSPRAGNPTPERSQGQRPRAYLQGSAANGSTIAALRRHTGETTSAQPAGAAIADDTDERGSGIGACLPQRTGHSAHVRCTDVEHPRGPLDRRRVQTGGGGPTMSGQPTSVTVTGDADERVHRTDLLPAVPRARGQHTSDGRCIIARLPKTRPPLRPLLGGGF